MQVRQRLRRVSIAPQFLPRNQICLCVCRCKMYPDMVEQVTTTTTTQTLIMGVAPSTGGFEAAAGAENGGCKCGASCTCDPCTCK
ncbi:Metallothionein-like protein type 2 [Zea mays]|uniref:Metallothionein-like protein n=1 Tax=Zea mays TaxID=4577 RepID=A0A1D6MLD9_MAIZE|nr:Metallothionein-like protein type 2 [Zea mays]